MQMWKPGAVLLLAILTSGCANPSAPTYVQPIADCQYYGTGTLVLVNLAETLNPRDAYVDGRFVGVIAYGNQLALRIDAGVVHIVDWVSSVTGGLVSSSRLAVQPCSTYTLTNDF
jgi:hypothetical protein